MPTFFLPAGVLGAGLAPVAVLGLVGEALVLGVLLPQALTRRDRLRKAAGRKLRLLIMSLEEFSTNLTEVD